MLIGQFTISLDGDNFSCQFDVEEDAIEHGKLMMDAAGTNSFFVGKTIHPIKKIGELKANLNIVSMVVIDKLDEIISIDFEIDKTQIINMTAEQKLDLANLIFRYIEDNVSVSWVTVDEISKYKIDEEGKPVKLEVGNV